MYSILLLLYEFDFSFSVELQLLLYDYVSTEIYKGKKERKEEIKKSCVYIVQWKKEQKNNM